MCGVLLIHSKKSKPLDRSNCLKSASELFNRGPDFIKYNFFYNDTLFIYNSILSITGKQKLNKSLIKSNNENYYTAYNGQIYNFRAIYESHLKNKINFNHKSDTEILVNLYEDQANDIPSIFNGMFAYVILNKKEKLINIVNDSQGEKNFYYYQDQDFFIISSTINPILKYLKNYQVDYKILKDYFFTRHFMPLENTCFKGIKLFKNSLNAKYCIKKNNLEINYYDDCLNWITEKNYSFFNSLSEDSVSEYLENALIAQLKLMIPEKKFGCITSGGIDSTLQTALISKIKPSSVNLVVDHVGKDKTIKYIPQFSKYLGENINIIKSNKNIYAKKIYKCYGIVMSPLQTHDLVGRLQVSEEFKKKKCKVFFSADGCDELFGGQQIYLKIFKNNYDYTRNISPYSSINNLGISFRNFSSDNYNKQLERIWKKVYKKYEYLENKERNIQSALFLDYFIQSINVANRSNDLISCNFSLEPRNVYIQRNILKIIINLPLKYKINFFSKDPNMIQKPILKKIFLKYFDKKLILKKQGFPGYPNYAKNILKEKEFKTISNLLEIKKINKKDKLNSRDLEWKLINTQLFIESLNLI